MWSNFVGVMRPAEEIKKSKEENNMNRKTQIGLGAIGILVSALTARRLWKLFTPDTMLEEDDDYDEDDFFDDDLE